MKPAADSRSLFCVLLLAPTLLFAQSPNPTGTPESTLSLTAPAASGTPEGLSLSAAPTPESVLAAPSPTPPQVVGLDASKFKDPVAKVNGKAISRRDFEILANSLLAAQGGTLVNLPPEQRKDFYKSVLQQMVNERLINEKAINQAVTPAEIDAEFTKLKGQFPDEAAFQKQLTSMAKTPELLKIDIETRKRQQKYLEGELKEKIKTTDAEMEKFYKEKPEFFKSPDTLRAAQILVAVPKDATIEVRGEKMKKARAIAERLQANPAQFEEVAKTESDDPKAKETGGDIGYFSKDRFPYPEFYDAVNKLSVGEVSDPLRTPDGFHVVKLTEKKLARTIPFDEAKPRILEFIEGQKRQAAFDKLVVVLRKGAKIEIFQEELSN